MDKLTLILSAIAAIASVISVVLVIKNNRENKRHMKNRLEAINDVYEGPFAYHFCMGVISCRTRGITAWIK